MSSGSVRTFRSHRTLPTSSTTQTDVSSTETSKPTKCAIAAAPSPMLEDRPTPIQSSYVKGLHVHRWKDQAQPPRYTIFPRFLSRKPPVRSRPASDVATDPGKVRVGAAGSSPTSVYKISMTSTHACVVGREEQHHCGNVLGLDALLKALLAQQSRFLH